MTDENNSFSNSLPRYWSPPGSERTIIGLNRLLELRSQTDIELHVKEIRKRGNQIKTSENDYKLSDFSTQKNEILENLTSAKCGSRASRIQCVHNDLEILVYIMELTYDDIVNFKDKKYIAGSTSGYTLPPSVYEISDHNSMIISFFPMR